MKTFYLLTLTLFFSFAVYGQKTKLKNLKMEKLSEQQWREKLTPLQYHVLREKGTERAFTGKYTDFFEKGHYVCAACKSKLFESDNKYESHCGWPSFDKAISGSVIYHKDTSFGMLRTEVTCAKCGGHLGHVFDDGPKQTTGQRYCTNSVSIEFVAEKS